MITLLLRFALWDRLGIAVSALCLAHCLLLPVVAAALPTLGLSWAGEGAVHTALGVSTASGSLTLMAAH